MAFFTEGPLPLDMIAREASGSRSRDAVTLTGDELLPPGTLLAGELPGDFTKAGGPGEVTAILLYWADPRAAPERVAALTRDCEVNSAYLVYDGMDEAAVANALRENSNIIVRIGVLVNPATDFAMSRQAWPSPPGAPFTAAGGTIVETGEGTAVVAEPGVAGAQPAASQAAAAGLQQPPRAPAPGPAAQTRPAARPPHPGAN